MLFTPRPYPVVPLVPQCLYVKADSSLIPSLCLELLFAFYLFCWILSFSSQFLSYFLLIYPLDFNFSFFDNENSNSSYYFDCLIFSPANLIMFLQVKKNLRSQIFWSWGFPELSIEAWSAGLDNQVIQARPKQQRKWQLEDPDWETRGSLNQSGSEASFADRV